MSVSVAIQHCASEAAGPLPTHCGPKLAPGQTVAFPVRATDHAILPVLWRTPLWAPTDPAVQQFAVRRRPPQPRRARCSVGDQREQVGGRRRTQVWQVVVAVGHGPFVLAPEWLGRGLLLERQRVAMTAAAY
jgi:hypothetical protein